MSAGGWTAPRLSEENRALMLQGRRQVLEDRATEMRGLLMDIVAQIDAGRYADARTGEMIDRVAVFGSSRERIIKMIAVMEGKQ